MKLVIVPLALGELHDAVAFYAESANVELGLALVVEFEQAVNALLANPNLGAVFRGNRRRCATGCRRLFGCGRARTPDMAPPGHAP